MNLPQSGFRSQQTLSRTFPKTIGPGSDPISLPMIDWKPMAKDLCSGKTALKQITVAGIAPKNTRNIVTKISTENGMRFVDAQSEVQTVFVAVPPPIQEHEV